MDFPQPSTSKKSKLGSNPLFESKLFVELKLGLMFYLLNCSEVYFNWEVTLVTRSLSDSAIK